VRGTILIYGNAKSRAIWNTLTADQRGEGLRAYPARW
jgi:hypothetical protein